MPTKKRKAAPQKVAAKKPAKAVKSADSFKQEDYSTKVVSIILYVWDFMIVVYTAMNIIALAQSNASSDTGTTLLNLFVVSILIFLALLVFKTARSLAENSDDGYLSGVVIMLFVAIFGFANMGWGLAFNIFGWIFLAIGALGLIFLLPNLGKFKRVDSHVLTTWALILHILFLFATVYVAPMVASNVVR